MNYLQFRTPKNTIFGQEAWSALTRQLQFIYGRCPITFYTEYTPLGILAHPLDREAGAVVVVRSGMPGDVNCFAEPGAETETLLQAALLIRMHSKGRVRVSSTLHRQRGMWEQAERQLGDLPGWDPTALARLPIHPLKPAQLWTGH